MGSSIGATLPKEMVDRLHIHEGDELTVMKTDQGLLITPYDPEFEEAMAAYERGARKYMNALRELSNPVERRDPDLVARRSRSEPGV